MNDSIRLGTIFGIEIRLHWSMPILLFVFWVGLAPSFGGLPQGLLVSGLLLLALETIVLLHELGHSLVARSYGLEVIDITFWPLGGMARMSRIPEDSRIEATIALAGPGVNLALAALALPAAALLGPEGLGGMLWAFVWMNLVLGGFNLLPAFPMDGGRVLRAVLARGGDWLGSTERAVRIGRWVALLMVVFAWFTGQWMMLFVAGFVWISGQKELMATRMRHTGSPFDLSAMSEVLRRAAAGGAGGVGGVAFDADERGDEGPRRPESPPQRPAAGPGGGFSDDDIAELEGFHGRLKSFRRDADDAATD